MTSPITLSQEAIERCLAALNLRRAGATYRRIGIKFKVSAQHASVLVNQGLRYEKEGIDALLSIRARNITQAVAGKIGGIYPTPYYIESNSWHPLDFLRQPGCGEQTFDEIITWMHMHGCWLDYEPSGKKKPRPPEPRPKRVSRFIERDFKIFLRRLHGKESLREIGEDYGITGVRVRQIINRQVRKLLEAI